MQKTSFGSEVAYIERLLDCVDDLNTRLKKLEFEKIEELGLWAIQQRVRKE